MFEFRLGEFHGGVCGAQVLACGKEAHVGVEYAFLHAAFRLLRGECGRFLGEGLGFHVQARGAPVPEGVGTGNAEVQAVMVLVVDKGMVEERILDACAYGWGIARLGLLDRDVGRLFAELGGFQLQARLLGLLEAVLQCPGAFGEANGRECREQDGGKDSCM